MQKNTLLLSLFLFFVGGCTMPGAFLSSGNEDTEIQNKLVECREKGIELQDVIEQVKQDKLEMSATIKRLDNENTFLYRKLEELNNRIERQKSVLSLQETVIRLFDDSEHSMQKNIEKQIVTQQNTLNLHSESGFWVIGNDVLFMPGTTLLSVAGKAKLMEIAHELADKDDVCVRVEGHADNRQLKKTSRYANNWELSALRAATVAAFLQESGGLPPERLEAIGHSYYQPLASNATAHGRQRNSRVEISAVAQR